MRAGLIVTAILVGVAAVGVLSTFNLGLALLCAPLVASCVTAVAVALPGLRRPRRHGIPVKGLV